MPLSRRSSANRLLLAIALVSCSPALVAGIYKWVDENGQVHYGERPQTGDAERMQLKIREPEPQPETDAGGEEKDTQAEQQQAQPAAEPEGEWVEQPLPRAERSRRCKNARARLENIMQRPRLKSVDSKGNVTALTPKQRDARIKGYKKDIRKYCR